MLEVLFVVYKDQFPTVNINFIILVCNISLFSINLRMATKSNQAGDVLRINVDSPTELVETSCKTAFNNSLQTYEFKTRSPCTDINLFLKLLSVHLRGKMLNLLKDHRSVTLMPVIAVEYIKLNGKGHSVTGYLQSQQLSLTKDNLLDQLIDVYIGDFIRRNEHFTDGRSCLMIDSIVCATMQLYSSLIWISFSLII